MSTLAIELTDPGILISDSRGVIVAPSPGYALLDGSLIVVGQEARAQARLKPRRSLNNFWDSLGTDSLPRPFPEQLTQADLVHRHLEALSKQAIDATRDGDGVEGVLLAVPGSFLTWQLGLLLGIARSAGLPVSGMVDSALASVPAHSAADQILHLEVLLNRIVWTEIDRTSGLVRQRVEESGSVGLVSLQDSWAKLIADQFVRSTRFDPMHNAVSEQALYDGLPGWLEMLRDEEVAEVSLEHGGRIYTIDVPKGHFIAAVEDQLRAVSSLAGALVASAGAPQILLTSRVAAIPGLQSRLAEMRGSEVVVLPEGAAAVGALANRHQIEAEGDELPFVVRLVEPKVDSLETLSPEQSIVDSASSLTKRPPTHVVYGGMAYPIREEPFWLGVALAGDQRGVNLTGTTTGISRSHCHICRDGDRVLVEDHSTYGTYLNERPIDGSSVAEAGDCLRLGSPGAEVLLIAVLESDG
jgi:hypothetical protein